MRIVKPAAVREWASRHADAAHALDRWTELMESGRWRSLAELRATFRAADEVVVESGRRVTIFNIGGNKYRLIAAVHYNRQIVFAMLFLTHAEYSKDRWKQEL